MFFTVGKLMAIIQKYLLKHSLQLRLQQCFGYIFILFLEVSGLLFSPVFLSVPLFFQTAADVAEN